MSPFRVALIGTGNSVKNHIEAVAHVGERAQLLAAVDLDHGRVQACCQQYGIPHAYTSAQQMLADIQPDLVLIVTPPASHLPLTLACLEAGADVYCEKPLCLSLAEFDQISQAEARHGRFVSTVAQWRFGSAAQHVKQLMDQGAGGRPLLAHCQTLWYRPAAYYQLPWRGRYASEGGGPTMNLGIHLMDLFLWLMGDWQEVQAIKATVDHDIEVEDLSLAWVRFANGALGSISNSVVSPRQESTIRIDFQRLTVELSALYRYTNANWRFTLPDNVNDEPLLAQWQQIPTDVKGTHGVQLSQILSSLAQRQRPFVSGAEARRPLEFVASLYKSAFTGQPVARGSILADDPFYHAMDGQPAR